MDTSEAVEAIIAIQKTTADYLLDTLSYKTEIAEILQELIADTTRAHLAAIEPFSRFQHMNHNAYVEAIEKAEIKGK